MITLTADGDAVKLSAFPARILESTLKGALSTLHGGENLIAALVRVEGDSLALVTLNGQKTETNEFVDDYLCGIVKGGVAALQFTEGKSVFEIRIT